MSSGGERSTNEDHNLEDEAIALPLGGLDTVRSQKLRGMGDDLKVFRSSDVFQVI